MNLRRPMARDKEIYAEQGFLILRQAFSKGRIESLLEGVESLIDKGLAGECDLSWIDRGRRLPSRTGHLLDPDKYHPAFADWIDEDLAPQLEAFVRGPGVRHSLFGMLAAGGGQAYTQKWHRDLGRPGDPDETAYLRRHEGRFVQFNAPLVAGDRFLHIVPGSHLRASTAAEIEASRSESGEMPNALVVELEPGDIVHYNANLWHRGWNPEGRKRWTMHCAFWSAGVTVMKHEHGQREALTRPGHLERMPPVTRGYIQRYLEDYPDGAPALPFRPVGLMGIVGNRRWPTPLRHWDGRDDQGRPLASGVYLYRLVTAAGVHTRKLTLLR